MDRDIAAEIIEGLQDAGAWLEGPSTSARTTVVHIPDEVDTRAVRAATGATLAEFSARFGIPVATLHKWERGTRRPDAAAKAYLLMILRNPKLVEETLRAE